MLQKTFPEYYREQLPLPFYVMLGLFVFSNMLLVINFTEPLKGLVEPARFAVNSILMILCVLYGCFHLLLWKLKLLTCAVAVIIITLAGFGWNYIGQTNEFFCTVVAVLLAFLAYGRDYKVMLKIILVMHAFAVLIAALGLAVGFTELRYKVDSTDIGFSMGLIYPNHVGRMCFLIFMIIWYLWGQKKKLLTLALGIFLSVFMWYVVKCKTITIFLIGFPVCWILWDHLSTHCTGRKAGSVFRKFFEGALVFMPFLCMIFTWIMGKNRVYFMMHWHYGQGIYALWMRFISAGILFKVYGFPLFGRDITDEDAIYEFAAGKVYEAAIVDNSYVYYLIAIGGIALIFCMLWFSLGVYRAVRNGDRAFLLMSVFMCGYGLIEIIFFQFEHNYLFFYPLTLQALAYRKPGDGDDQTKSDISQHAERCC